MKNSIEEQAQAIIDDAINRYTDYLYSTNPDKGKFDNTTHVKQITEIVKARDAAVRIDQMTEDLGISKASIAVNREELITELRREDGKN